MNLVTHYLEPSILKFAFLIFKYFPYGGVQRDMLRIALDLTALGHVVTIYTGEWRGDKPNGLNVVLLSVKGLFNHQRHKYLIDAMLNAVKQTPVDFVVGFNRMAGLDAYYAADPCFMARAKEERGWWYRFSGRYRFFAKTERAVFAADSHCKVLVLTPREKVVFQHFYQTPAERFYALPPNIPVARFSGLDKISARKQLRAEFNLPTDAQVLLTVGSAFVRKGLDRLIIALAQLPEAQRLNTWIVAVGEDKAEPMYRIADKHQVRSQLIIAGARNDVPNIMLGADVFVHPARSELAGLVIIEAMTAGLPVVVTENCGYAPHVGEANAGIVLPELTAQAALNAALPTLLSDQKASTQFGLAGQVYTQHIAATTSSHVEADLLIGFAATQTQH